MFECTGKVMAEAAENTKEYIFERWRLISLDAFGRQVQIIFHVKVVQSMSSILSMSVWFSCVCVCVCVRTRPADEVLHRSGSTGTRWRHVSSHPEWPESSGPEQLAARRWVCSTTYFWRETTARKSAFKIVINLKVQLVGFCGLYLWGCRLQTSLWIMCSKFTHWSFKTKCYPSIILFLIVGCFLQSHWFQILLVI